MKIGDREADPTLDDLLLLLRDAAEFDQYREVARVARSSTTFSAGAAPTLSVNTDHELSLTIYGPECQPGISF